PRLAGIRAHVAPSPDLGVAVGLVVTRPGRSPRRVRGAVANAPPAGRPPAVAARATPGAAEEGPCIPAGQTVPPPLLQLEMRAGGDNFLAERGADDPALDRERPRALQHEDQLVGGVGELLPAPARRVHPQLPAEAPRRPVG